MNHKNLTKKITSNVFTKSRNSENFNLLSTPQVFSVTNFNVLLPPMSINSDKLTTSGFS